MSNKLNFLKNDKHQELWKYDVPSYSKNSSVKCNNILSIIILKWLNHNLKIMQFTKHKDIYP